MLTLHQIMLPQKYVPALLHPATRIVRVHRTQPQSVLMLAQQWLLQVQLQQCQPQSRLMLAQQWLLQKVPLQQ